MEVQKHWRSVNDALASCWNSLAMVGEALTTTWRRYIHWRWLATLGDFFEHSKKIAKLDEALTTADDHWRCNGNVLTMSGDALAMCPKLLVASVCLFWIRTRICPAGSTPEGGPTEKLPYHPGHSSPPGLVVLHVPYPPILIVMHPASGQSPPLSSCPIQISYQVSGLPPPSPDVASWCERGFRDGPGYMRSRGNKDQSGLLLVSYH